MSQFVQPEIFPDPTTLFNACKLSINEDKPIMLDYWRSSLEQKALIGVKEYEDNGEKVTEKILVKSQEEFTSPIVKIFKSVNEYIVITENSIYIVSNRIQSNRISWVPFMFLFHRFELLFWFIILIYYL